MEWLKKILEELKKLAGEDKDLTELETAIKTGVQSEVERSNATSLEGIKKKNQELLAKLADPKLKSEKEMAAKLQELLEAYEFEDYTDLEAAVHKLKNPGSDGQAVQRDLEAKRLQSDLKKAQAEIESLKSAIDEGETFITKTLVEDAFKTGLLKLQIDPLEVDAILPSFLGKAQVIKDEKGDRKAVLNDTGQTIEEYLTDWRESDIGKRFVPAPRNSGSGAGGQGNSIADPKAERFKELNAKETLSPQENVELMTIAQEMRDAQASNGGK